MKKVLIISYYWPPAGGSGVQRWLKFSKYLGRKNSNPGRNKSYLGRKILFRKKNAS